MEKDLKTLTSKNAVIQLEDLCKNAVELIQYSRSIALKQVDLIQVMTYFVLGKWIVDVQQEGAARAEYGKNVLNTLPDRLNKTFGKGFSVSTLTNIRKFYLTYQERISEPVVTEFIAKKSQPSVTILQKEPPFQLSWTHYLLPKDNNQIFASQYQLYLPDKTLLQNKLKEWIAEETRGEEP